MSPEAHAFLVQHGFEKYKEKISRLGVQSRDDLRLLNLEDLRGIGMEEIKARRFMDLVLRAPGGFADVSTVLAEEVNMDANLDVAEAVVVNRTTSYGKNTVTKPNGTGTRGLKQLYGSHTEATSVIPSAPPQEPQKIAKLLFLIDITASMQYAINDVKERIKEIIRKAEQQFTGIALHVGCVGYRDYSDEEQYVVHDFVGDQDTFVQRLEAMEASGGGDVPEDVLGGMNMALTAVSWNDRARRNETRTVCKVIFHICDAPHHGSQFHDPGATFEDRYPEKADFPRLYSDICRDIASNKIDYYFAQVKSAGTKGSIITHTMAEKLKRSYDSVQGKSRAFTIVRLDSYTPEKLFQQVLSGITTSITTAMSGRL